MRVLLFEDRFVEHLHPITTGRGAFAVTCGTFRVTDLAEYLAGAENVSVLCRPYIDAYSRLRYKTYHFGGTALEADLHSMPKGEHVLVLNARVVPRARTLEFLEQLVQSSETRIGIWQDTVAFAWLSAEDLLTALHGLSAGFYDISTRISAGEMDCEHPVELFDYPHDVVRQNMEIFQENVAYRLEHVVPGYTGVATRPRTSGHWTEVQPGVFVGENVHLGEYLAVDTSGGPILIEDGASIGPFCFLKGPVYIGPYSRVIEHSALKEFVGLAHTTKVGGEVEASNIEPYTNKQHHGFLGHSYLGSWINLGAGTSNSDLKNTYGTISIDYADGRTATAMQFLGCIIGDYSKTAINTSIFTGKVIGCCSMVYGFVTRNVPSFVNFAKSFNQCTEISVEVMAATQRRMFERRHVEQSPEHLEVLRQMFVQTARERQMENEPLSL